MSAMRNNWFMFQRINYTMYKQILQDLYWYVENINNGEISILASEIPTAILLAGEK